ncbi:uncharacterized protein LOC118390562 [Oncorhynchus keta]|uniref:uncharacterized protein LOC118390562 n=1 Tax=Oncorhynchus keta TaxID=8018 RepID=UPI0015FD159E|nr:uncharacterized protein LOC118390562 [Oncorhynchus keta]XP_052313403.1 uncharacterized protein LOC118390562 [Oncorhynchus keta]
MRPRSRLLAKRWLPTIREGYEELVQDMNQANSRHLPPHGQAHSPSTHDYFLSICQLARPTFPQGEPDCDILTVGTLTSLRPCLRLHRLRDPVSPCLPLISKVSRHTQLEQGESQNECSGPERVVDVSSCQTSSRVVPSVSDPLEFLYGHREGLLSAACRAHDSQGRMGEGSQSAAQSRPQPPVHADSFPRMCSSPLTQRKNSRRELWLVDPTDQKKPSPDPARPETSSSDQQKPDASSSFSWRFQNSPDRAPAGERGKCTRYMDHHTMVSHWIADCRSAWREARIRACMLPAIAEM